MSASREQLQGLIAHQIERVNVTTGLRENFGTIVDGYFSDKNLQKSTSVLPLQHGNSYRYEIFALYRETETMVPNLIKSTVDSRTGVEYRYAPLKFKHPIVKNEGMIVTMEGLNKLYPYNELEHGKLGMSGFYEVSFEINSARISDLYAVSTTANSNVITWKTIGDIKTIDHFLIMKESHGIRTMITAVHPNEEISNYTHELSEKDAGSLRYIILPVYINFELGKEAITNTIIVNP